MTLTFERKDSVVSLRIVTPRRNRRSVKTLSPIRPARSKAAFACTVALAACCVPFGWTASFVRAELRGQIVCPHTCGDMDGDSVINLADFADFAGCFGLSPGLSVECACSDLNTDGVINLVDFSTFASLFGGSSTESPPNCLGGPPPTADLTAYRPQHRTGYAPFARTPVPDADEENNTLGPGIRINHTGDTDPAGEDDLIEVLLTIDPPGAELMLRRETGALRVWTTRDKQTGTEIPFTSDRTAALPIGPTDTQLTLWIEWADAAPATAALSVEPLNDTAILDTLRFHAFQGIVAALGGEDQTPADPPDPNAGTFVVAVSLYNQGYDVHMFDEDNVAADGSGPVYDEVVNAIQNRSVNDVAIYGYSHGGGSTYDLADRLDLNRAGIGVFEITWSSYVDSVSNNSDLDVAQELRRPPSTAYHANHYQHGAFLPDFFLDGGPVPDSNPPPTGLDVETTPWGASSTHFDVDDYPEVRGFMETTLLPRVTR